MYVYVLLYVYIYIYTHVYIPEYQTLLKPKGPNRNIPKPRFGGM